MRSLLKSVNASWLWIFLGLQFAVYTLLPTFFRHNVPFDTVEGIAWGNQWQWGYDKHPPLAAWLSAFVTNVGHAVGWPVYLLAQIAVVVTFLAVWQIAKKILNKEQAILAVLLLFGVLYYSAPSITVKFNPTTLMSPLWALTMLFFYNALTKPKVWRWILLGIFAALCILAKYESLVLLFCVFCILLLTREGLESFNTEGPYLALSAFIVALSPHIFWSIHHHFPEIGYATFSLSGRGVNPRFYNNFYYPSIFFVSQVFSVLPMFLLALPFRSAPKTAKISSEFDKIFLLLMGLGPLFFTLIVSAITGCYLNAKWATPFFVLTSVMLVAFLRPIVLEVPFKRFIWLLFVLFFTIFYAQQGYLYIWPQITKVKHYPDYFFPGKEIAAKVTSDWHKQFGTRLSYVAGDHYLVANIAAYSSDHPTPFFDWNSEESPWVDRQLLQKMGGVFVWSDSDINMVKDSYAGEKLQFPHLGELYFAPFNYANPNYPKFQIAVATLVPQL